MVVADVLVAGGGLLLLSFVVVVVVLARHNLVFSSHLYLYDDILLFGSETSKMTMAMTMTTMTMMEYCISFLDDVLP